MSLFKKIINLAVFVPVIFSGIAFCGPVFLTQAANEDVKMEPNITEVKIINPLNGIDSIEQLIVAILNIFMVIMVPVIVLFIILAGFKYVTAQGNAGKIEEATQTLMYAVIGGVLILGAVVIAEIIKNTVQSFTS